MKEIAIANQPWLSMKRTVKITVDGIKYRLFRASVTVAVITLAVAFLMNILAESLVKRAIASNTRERIQNSRRVYDWSARLSSPGSAESVITEIASSGKMDDNFIEARNFAGIGDVDMADFQEQTIKIVSILNFFDGLDYAKRRSMIHTAEGLGILRRLKEAQYMEQFKTALGNIKSVHFEMPFEELDSVLAKLDATEATVAKILAGRSDAIAKISASLAGRTPMEALVDADKGFGDAVRDAGFIFDADIVAPVVSVQARRLIDTLNLEKTIEIRVTTYTKDDSKPDEPPNKKVELPFRQLIAQHANLLPADVNTVLLWKYMSGKRFAGKYIEKLRSVSELIANTPENVSIEGVSSGGLGTDGLTPERLVELANLRTENATLLKAERLTMDAGKGFMGLGERLAWLLFVSMLVCGIGITNAMMMSVTERFNEIATLKCLGALDGFIMIMFVLESCFMGLVGGAIGSIIGAVIGLGRMLSSFGINFFTAVPFVDVLLGMLVSILLGTLLAAISAVIPSFKAARLAPMEAMRVE